MWTFVLNAARAEAELPSEEAEARNAGEYAVAIVIVIPLASRAVHGELLVGGETLRMDEQYLAGVESGNTHPTPSLLHVGAGGAHTPVAVRDARLTGVRHEVALDRGLVCEASLPPVLERTFELGADVALRPVLEIRLTLTHHREKQLEYTVVIRHALVTLHETQDRAELRLEEEPFGTFGENDLWRAVLTIPIRFPLVLPVWREQCFYRGRRCELRPEVAQHEMLRFARLRCPALRRGVVRRTALVLIQLDAQGIDPAHLLVHEGDERRGVPGPADPFRVLARPARFGDGRAGGGKPLRSDHVKGRRHDDSASSSPLRSVRQWNIHLYTSRC